MSFRFFSEQIAPVYRHKRHSTHQCLAEIDDAAHDNDEGNVNLHGELQQLPINALGTDSRHADGDALGRNHLAGAGSRSVGSRNPGLHLFACTDGLGRPGLELAEEHAGRGGRAGDESADGADEGCHHGVHGAGDGHRRMGQLQSHAAVVHDLGSGDDGDDGDDGETQVHHGLFEHAQHLTHAGTLHGAADEGRQENQDARGIHPGKGIGSAALAAIDEHRALDGGQWIMDARHQLGGEQQEHENQDEGQPSHQSLAGSNFLLGARVVRMHLILGIIHREHLGTGHNGGHGANGTCHHSQFRAHGAGDEVLRDEEGQACSQAHDAHALQALEALAGHDGHEEGAKESEGCQLQGSVASQSSGINARDAAQGHQRDTDGAVSRRHRVGDEADAHSHDGRNADACQHARRDSDSSTEACHALQEAAEAPADEENQGATIRAHRGQHGLDDLHAFGVHHQVVSKDSCDNDQEDRPAGESHAIQGGLRRQFAIQAKHGHGCRNRDDESCRASLMRRHMQYRQGDNQPENR